MLEILTLHYSPPKSTKERNPNENTKLLLWEIEAFLVKIRNRMCEVIEIWDDLGLFNWNNSNRFTAGEDFSYTSVIFWDPSSKEIRYPDSAQMASSNANFGIPPSMKGIMDWRRCIRLDDSFFAHLNNRKDITPDQWKFFLLLGIGHLWYAGPHGKLNELRHIEDVSVWSRRMRADISALDDFALRIMQLIEGDIKNLWSPFSFIKDDIGGLPVLVFPLQERIGRFQQAQWLM